MAALLKELMAPSQCLRVNTLSSNDGGIWLINRLDDDFSRRVWPLANGNCCWASARSSRKS